MNQLGILDHLNRGQRYTFQFALSGTSANMGFISDANPVLRTLGNITQVDAGYNGGLFITQPYLYVSFTYTGTGQDTVNDLQTDMMDILAGTLSGIDLSNISLATATTGEDIKNPDVNVKDQLNQVMPSKTTLTLLVVGLALIAFLASGGASIVRRATE